MACSHTAACPLFPLLNSSLDGWRRCYCDSEDGWRGCARYQQSLRGQYVPLSLLPNGHDARHLQGATSAGSPGAPAPGSSSPTLVDLLFEQAPAPGPTPPADVWGVTPIPGPPSPGPPASAAPPSLHEPGPIRRWWARLAEWMRTPA